MDRAGHQFLSGSRLAEDEDRAGARGEGGQDLEQPLHQRAAADKFTRVETACEFMPQRVDFREIAKNLCTADNLAALILEHRR